MSEPTTSPTLIIPPPRPRALDPRSLGFQPRKPVPWLGPVLLANTGARLALAEQFGAYLDKRELQSAFDSRLHDHSVAADGSAKEELWFDFVADLGDGFNATYSVAHTLAQPSLDVDGQRLPRGEVLVLGGDQVYPSASSHAYEDRFRGPYRAAMPTAPPGQAPPTMYALPGNHDWFDGLTAFLRVFARRDGGSVGGWRTAQTRSYFALKLPQRWWLFAIDAQPGTYLDDPQLAYFRQHAAQLRPGDRVIVCTPNPFWVQAKDEPGAYDTTDYFIRKIINPTGATVSLMLSGDLHHYARYSNGQRELITSGGGGAYLYPTHKLPKKLTVPPRESLVLDATSRDQYKLNATYPSKARSRWLGFGVFTRLPVRNPGFVTLLGILQALLLLALDNVGGQILPKALMVVAVMTLTVFLSVGLGQARRLRRYLLGLIHGMAQVGLGIGGLFLWRMSIFHDWTPPWRDLVAIPYGVVAGLVSAQLFAVYLLIASTFGVNVNELFAGQGIQGYKNFLRMHIARDGTLTIYPIGIDTTAKRWRATPTAAAHEPWFEPRRPMRPRLAEAPIQTKPSAPFVPTPGAPPSIPSQR